MRSSPSEWHPGDRIELDLPMAVQRGSWREGTPMIAIPYYARANRTGMPIREFPRGEGAVEYAPGASKSGTGEVAVERAPARAPSPDSVVWLTDIA